LFGGWSLFDHDMNVVQSIGHPIRETLDGAIDGSIEISPIHSGNPNPTPDMDLDSMSR
jgi:hypothetical protein